MNAPSLNRPQLEAREQWRITETAYETPRKLVSRHVWRDGKMSSARDLLEAIRNRLAMSAKLRAELDYYRHVAERHAGLEDNPCGICENLRERAWP